MSISCKLPFLLCALLPLTALPQSSPGENHGPPADQANTRVVAPDDAELTKLLTDFLAGASRNDVAIHDRFWADDLIYTGSSGRRLGKAELMREVREEENGKDKNAAETATYTAEEIRIQQYGDTAIVAFKLVGTTRKGETTEIENYLNSGTFLKRGGKWQVVNWQATKLPAAGDSKK